MRIVRKEYRTVMALKFDPLTNEILKKNNIVWFVVWRENSVALRKRPEPDNLFTWSALLHINVAPVGLKPNTTTPFSFVCADNSVHYVAIALISTIDKGLEVASQKKLHCLFKVGVQVSVLLKLLNRDNKHT